MEQEEKQLMEEGERKEKEMMEKVNDLKSFYTVIWTFLINYIKKGAHSENWARTGDLRHPKVYLLSAS